MPELVTDETLLRRPCEPATLKEAGGIARTLTDFIQRQNKKRENWLRRWDGKTEKESCPQKALGLAAPQLGLLKRVAVVHVGGIHTLINPVIIEHSSAVMKWTEACLSLPGVQVETQRWLWVVVKSDNWASPKRFGPTEVFKDTTRNEILSSICVQHEIAHLYSLTINDFAVAPPEPSEWEAWGRTFDSQLMYSSADADSE
jgi:peptide deformylase